LAASPLLLAQRTSSLMSFVGRFFDAIEVAEVGGERLCDSCFESVGIDRLKEAAGQASSESTVR
jgi:hypothetical protein